MAISISDFTGAIQDLSDIWNSVPDLGGLEWQDITIVKTQTCGNDATPYLRLTKRIPNSTSPQSVPLEPAESDELPLEEHDPESLPSSHHPPPSLQIITYTVLHSPTYLVPILYITLSSPLSSSTPSTSLYDLLVPPLYKSSLQNRAIGVLGGLSATTHPETGRSCFWVHPCLTQEGMKGLGVRGEKDGVGYVMGWMGIVGGGVGLNVPVEVATAVVERRKSRELE